MKRLLNGLLFFIGALLPFSARTQTVGKYCYSSFYSTNDSVLVAGGQIASGFGNSPQYYVGYYPLQYSMLGIEETGPAGLQVYPNPFEDQFNVVISTAYSPGVRIEVYNLQGQLMLNTPAAEMNVVDAAWFSPGIYLLILTENGVATETHKLVKY